MDNRVQWHPGFCAAMELELWDNRDDLEYEREYNLSKKPLQADLLVIRKRQNASIHNEIGQIFRTWNLMEYKSPVDSMNIDDFYKVNAYACLFKAQAKQVNGHPASEITITMIRQRYPERLIKVLEQDGFHVVEKKKGIYEVTGNLLFQTQIVVSDRLEGEEHIWLRSLTDRIERQEFQTLADNIMQLNEFYEKECADAVLEVVTNANGTNIEKWKEDTIMCEALARIMEPEISQAKEIAKREGRAEGRAFEVYTSVQEGDYGAQRGAEKLGISVEEFEKRMVEAGYHIPV